MIFIPISIVKKVSFISDQSLKICIRATVVVNFTGIGTVSRASSRFRPVGIRTSNQKSFCVIFSLVSRGSVHERPYQSANPSIRFHYPDNNFIFVNSKRLRFIIIRNDWDDYLKWIQNEFWIACNRNLLESTATRVYQPLILKLYDKIDRNLLEIDFINIFRHCNFLSNA